MNGANAKGCSYSVFSVRLRRTIVMCALALLSGALTPSFGQSAPATQTRKSPALRCLPSSIGPYDIVTYGRNGSPDITVSTAIRQLKGRCIGAKLVDRRGREVRFFRHECWGNPPADYHEILDSQQRELASLKKKYTVVEIGCDTRVSNHKWRRNYRSLSSIVPGYRSRTRWVRQDLL